MKHTVPKHLRALSDSFYSGLTAATPQPSFAESLALKENLPTLPELPTHTKQMVTQATDVYDQLPPDVAEMNRADDKELMRSHVSFEALLPFVSKAYALSADPADYFFRPIPLFLSELPNRNGIGFPAAQLVRWSVEGGCQAYMTWKGKPMHVEHQDQNPLDAIGFIPDVAMVPLKGYGDDKLWKVIALSAFDRTKHEVCPRIETKDHNTFSMGCVVDDFYCSYCGAEVGKCRHIDSKAQGVQLYELNGRLVYKLVGGIMGKELSAVDDPAAAVCSSDLDLIVLR